MQRTHDNKNDFYSLNQTANSLHRRRRRSRAYQASRRRSRLIRRISLSMTPFVIFLIGLTVVSIGFCNYIEQDSILAMFLTSRNASATTVLHGADWETVSTEDPELQTAALGKSGRLLVPFFYVGQRFGTISIPSVKIEVDAYQGDSEREFRKGAGHYAASYFPGQGGNILIAAHRTSYFRNFQYLKVGALVNFETTYGKYIYKVRELKIIDGKDASVAAESTVEQLTMYTCYPFNYIGNAPKRFVVICDLVEGKVG